MTGCLDDNEASEFASGSLAGDAAMRVERHLAGCRDCRSLVAMLAAAPDDADADSDVVTAPRKVALGKKGRRANDLGNAPTERPQHPTPTTEPMPGKRRDPVVANGDTIGRYIILARLGAGGMGVVYTAYDPQLDRKVALKLLRSVGGVAESEGRSRLVREAQAIAQLSHPNVVAVYDVGTADTGEVYIAMELVEGETLTSWLGHWDRSWREILELFFQAGRGLAAAHARGLVHRDFKPDNVLVGTDGRVRVTDFGLARSLIEQVDEQLRDTPRPDLEALRVTLTATGTVLGTPRYMAPEQLKGADADARSDQFSFCIALYEALYGRHPLMGDSVIEMVQHGAEPEPAPEDTKVPPVIGRAISRGLSREPGKRFPSLAALLLELTPPVVQTGRRGWIALAVGLALVVGGAAAAMYAMDLKATREQDKLRGELDEAREERDDLVAQINRVLYADGGLADKSDQLRVLQAKVEEKDAKIEQLSAKLGVLTDAAPAAPVHPRPLRVPIDAAAAPVRGVTQSELLAGTAARQSQIESCMGEWMERNPGDAAALTVSFDIAPDGTVRAAHAKGMDDVVTPGCVENAVERAAFPPTNAETKAELAVTVEDGKLHITSRMIGASVPGQTIDLGGSPTP